MLPRQLRLFKHAKPLLDRFGAGFFRAFPEQPGVYIMTDETGRVLYIGQSGNLRARLGTYRNANPDHVSRKVIRLVHAVRKIEWEVCATPAQACVRENELLRTHRPRFNSVNTYPKAYYFIEVKTEDRELTFRITTQETPSAGLHGAFKPRSARGYAALLRLLWAALNQPASPVEFPRRLLGGKPAREYSFEIDQIRTRFDLPHLAGVFDSFLAGTSPDLIDLLRQHLPLAENLQPFHRALQSADLELLEDFYKRGPERNRALRDRYGIESQQIPQERLDDLLALSRLSRPKTDPPPSPAPLESLPVV